MPMVSKRQNRFMRWADENPEQAKAEGMDPKVARKFISDSHGQKVGKLPERAPQRKAEGGSVSSKPFCTAPTKW